MDKSIKMRQLVFLPLLCFLLLCGKLYGAPQQDKISLSLKEASITQFFKEIEARTAFKFFYKDSQVENAPSVTIEVNDQTLEYVLNTVFDKTNLTYEITGNQIVIKQKPGNNNTLIISGIVTEKNRQPLPGVGVILQGTRKGAYTDENGTFSIEIPKDGQSTLNFRMIGMNDVTIVTDGRSYYQVTMEESTQRLDEVVITGIVTRKAESFTGSVTAISSKEIMRAGNRNLFESLKNIDPSLYIMDNLLNGSNPNALPGMELRGTSSFPASSS